MSSDRATDGLSVPGEGAPQAQQRRAPTPLLLDAAEAAQLVGIGRSTFYRLDETGGVPRCVRLGRMRRWRSDELHAWIAAGCPPRARWEALKK